MIEGQTVGQYRIHRKIGEGGMGAVYLAEHALIGRRAAIKVLLPGLSAQREIVERFFNEARATTAIPDPGIVQVFDFGIHVDGSAFIVMEYLEGEPLDARMKRQGRISSFEALRITRQAAGSLGAAHAAGIVHRDLKPENIFLVRDQEAQGGERPKILDFGIAKLGGIGNMEPGQMRTRTGAMMGTPVYMSPEQCRGAGQVDHRSDIYSMGCVLFHMITGRPPFEGEGVGEIIAAHLREPPRAPSSVIAGLPEGVDELVLTCLAKAVEPRFQSMLELQRACDGLMTRITANGASAPTVAIATPVPPGFRSEYPGATHASLPSGTQPPPFANQSQPGTVQLNQPTTLGSAAGQTAAGTVTARKRPWALLAIVALFFAGGGVAAAVVLGGKSKPAATDEIQAADPVEGSSEEAVGEVGSGSGSGSVTAVATPDAGVAVITPDAGVTATTDVGLQPDAGSGSASLAVTDPGKGSGSGSSKKKTVKKKTVKKTGKGSGEEDLYGDRN